ncbi:BMA-AVR-14, isoform d [Aphelenchoides bicaudatus]|nr:BMA-AVR-14, isoform d [Aphelenchoides bicaudatus]
MSVMHKRPKKKLKEQDIIQRVLKDYDWRVRPRGFNDSWPDTGGPVVVSVNIYLRSISKIDDVNMEYSAQFTFREEWWDARLAYERFADENTHIPPFVVLATSDSADLSRQVWMPDTFFQNEKEARRHLIDKPNVLIRIYPNGQILYSVRLSLVLSCPMSLEYYPLDHQTCLIDLASYAYTTDDIKYEWKAENPIQQKDGLRQSLPSFELQDVLTDYCTSKTNTGEYSCLRTKMILRREFSYYLLQLYIPSCMLVIVSWVSFWLDKDSVPARVTLGVTTLLTMTTQSSGINAKLPPVSYTKAVDVWIGVCMAFIFGALLEFALVNYAARKDISSQQRLPRFRAQSIDTQGHYQLKMGGNGAQDPFLRNNHPADSSYHNLIVSSGGAHHPQSVSSYYYACCCRIFVRRYKERSKRIDVVSRLVFPIGYACFNGEYSCARVQLMLRREYSYYLIQLYLPCCMLVVVSWVSFWLDKDAVPARVSLGVTTLLTMTTQASGINSKLPPVSYIKASRFAVDVWIGSCLAFVFSALLEYALVNYYGRREFMKKERSKKIGGLQQVVAQLPSLMSPDCLCPPSAVHPDFYTTALQQGNNNTLAPNLTSHRPSMRLDLGLLGRKTLSSKIKSLLGENLELSKRVDLISRFTFPALFGLFLVFYYLVYVFLPSISESKS